MKNKSTLVLIEQIVMLLVFAIAATVCVRMFVTSDRMSEKNAATDRAVIEAQNAAEHLKRGGVTELADKMGALKDSPEKWIVYYDSEWNVMTTERKDGFSLTVSYTDATNLWEADISVASAKDGELFRIRTAGQR